MKSFLKKKKVWIPLVLFIVGIAGFFSQSQDETLFVETETVNRADIIHKVNASGKLQPEEEVQITSTITAWITEITVSEGDTVYPGEHLITLDETQYKANVEQAESMVKSAKANLRKNKLQLDRTNSLHSRNLISSQELEAVEAQFLLAESQLEQAGASLKSRRDELSKTRLLAPQYGVVTSITKEVGEMAVGGMFQPGILMSIADLNRMEILVNVNENDVVLLSIGDTSEIEVDAFQDTVFFGVVREIAHVAETSNFGNQNQVTNFKVKITMLDVHPLFRPGMSTTANIITEVKNNVLSIPIQCLTVRPEDFETHAYNGDKGNSNEDINKKENSYKKKEMVEIVFVVEDTIDNDIGSGKDGLHVLGRPVQLGISSDTHYEVLGGLKEGETVVSGSYKAISRELWHKAPVRIVGGFSAAE
ncbi:MAG: efflux RND transporter periplasmic adaptor subunit [Candidatus Marinimicrobia bacterium]|nr:efflux RND transporter periplasmic adaptor subunit [Candidatus Neomarinimicrobiota bacterium]